MRPVSYGPAPLGPATVSAPIRLKGRQDQNTKELSRLTDGAVYTEIPVSRL